MSGRSRTALSDSLRHTLGSARKDSPVQSKAKRYQVIVACNACRRRKIKCDGSRPVCSRCSSKKICCTWSADPNTTPMLAMKQRYQSLESECRDLHSLLQLLIDRPRQEALIILDNMRDTRDVSLTLSFVGDDSFTNLTNTADSHSISSNSTTSVHECSRHVSDTMLPPNQEHNSSSGNSEDRRSRGSHSPMRRLAITDLLNDRNT